MTPWPPPALAFGQQRAKYLPISEKERQFDAQVDPAARLDFGAGVGGSDEVSDEGKPVAQSMLSIRKPYTVTVSPYPGLINNPGKPGVQRVADIPLEPRGGANKVPRSW